MADEVSDTGAPSASPEERLASYFSKEAAPARAESPDAPPQDEQEGAVSPQEADSQQEDGQEGEQPEDDQASDAPPDGFVELEHLGRRYHVPPDLKQAFEANRAMATKAAMELAPVRKALEVEKFAMQAAKVVDAQLQGLNEEMSRLISYKEQAKKLDWSALSLDQKVDLDRELRQLDDRLMQLNGELSAKRADFNGRLGEVVVAAVANSEQYLAHKVPGWNVQRGQALHNYGLENGIPPEKLVTAWFADPIAAHIMWKAQQWDGLQASKPSVNNRSRNAPPVIRPASNQVQKSVAASNYQKVRQNLKKTGSLEDFAAALLARKG